MTNPFRLVLLVDDDEDDNYFHKIVIRECGIANEIVIQEDAESALSLIESGTLEPDLIFVDLNMPRINGWEFITELQRAELLIKPIIVILTTSFSAADRKKALTMNIAYFETKPLTPEKLNAMHSKWAGS